MLWKKTQKNTQKKQKTTKKKKKKKKGGLIAPYYLAFKVVSKTVADDILFFSPFFLSNKTFQRK